MNILILNTKGGVGKSTIAQHVLCPYLYLKGGGVVNLFEIDELNFDSINLSKTKVFHSKCLKLSQLNPSSFSSLFESNLNVIDVGGNISAVQALKFFGKAHILDVLDLIIVPVMSGLQDALNAKQIYKEVSGKSGNRVFLALNRVKNEENLQFEFPHIFGFDDVASVFSSVPEYILIPDDSILEYAKNFGQTVFELAEKNVEELLQKRKEALKQKNRERALKLTQRIYLVERARDFMRKLEALVYPVLDKTGS